MHDKCEQSVILMFSKLLRRVSHYSTLIMCLITPTYVIQSSRTKRLAWRTSYGWNVKRIYHIKVNFSKLAYSAWFQVAIFNNVLPGAKLSVLCHRFQKVTMRLFTKPFYLRYCNDFTINDNEDSRTVFNRLTLCLLFIRVTFCCILHI